MTKKEIVAKEKNSQLINEDATGLYFIGKGVNTLFAFKGGNLVQVIDEFEYKRIIPSQLKQIYTKINNELTGKFGEPVSKSAIEADGALEYSFKFQTKNGTITHFLKGKGVDLRHALNYQK